MARQGKSKLIRDISANTFQTVGTQLFTIIIFYLMSRYLPKEHFGEFNWSVAVGFIVISFASLGMDLVLVKKLASGQDVLLISGIHFFHTSIVGLLLICCSLFLSLVSPGFSADHPFFTWIMIYVAVFNIANSFRLCLNGLEAYRRLALLAFLSNGLRLALVVAFFLNGALTIEMVIAAYMISSLVEMIAGYFLITATVRSRLRPVVRPVEYRYFILESLPQLGVVIFDSALTRVDLILLGVMSTDDITAEYSFAYKIYELSKLPLIIIAPVLLTRFSKIFAGDQEIPEHHRKNLGFFLGTEVFIILFIPIVLITAWSPLVDYFTDGKYGAVNERTYAILAPCVPLIAVVNYLWTIGFVQGKLKKIFFITMTIAVLNVLLNLFMIPRWGRDGAAIAFLISTIVQVALYVYHIRVAHTPLGFGRVACLILLAAASVLSARMISNNIIFTSLIATCIFAGTALLTKLASIRQIREVFLNR